MTFSIDILIKNIINEDLDFEPKKAPSRKLKFPCSICSNSVMKNQKAVQCDTCDLWAHTKCDGTSDATYTKLLEDTENKPWHCLVCRIRQNHKLFPFMTKIF